MKAEEMASQCLAGVRVIDLSHVIAGPVASMYLAALGADVLKIENPRAPDVMRYVEPDKAGGMSTTFATLNAGKRSLAIDLKNPRLRAVLLELVRDADVFIENFRPGTAERMGLGYEAIRAINPRIVYLSISGYGQNGAWSRYGAYDQVIQALSGMMMANGEEDGPPTKVGFPVIDIATGMLGAMSVLAALHRRTTSGVGGHIETSLAEAALQLMRPIVARVVATRQDEPRPGNRGFSGSPGAATFRCADGWLAVAANTRTQFRALCDLLGLDGVPDDPSLVVAADGPGATNVAPVDGVALGRRLEEAFAHHRASELESRLNEAGVPAARVRRIGEFLREAGEGRHVPLDLQTLDRESFLQLGPGMGGLAQAAGKPAPDLGASTWEVLRRAGFGALEIAELACDGAIRLVRSEMGERMSQTKTDNGRGR